MTLQVDVPLHLTPSALDRRLSNGWFRSGPILFRASVLHPDEQLRELVHMRLRLDSPPSRSKRKLLSRNRRAFRCVIGPARLDDERRALYVATRARFLGFVASELDVVAMGEYPDVFDTREVAVYDGDKLVAIGYFDVGKRAVASILGLHDPAYHRYSLGIYTMLEEMEFGRRRGARFYYPGYVIPGLPGFDYKLNLGPAEFLSPAGRWRALSKPPTATPAADYAVARMEELEAALLAEQVPHERWIYPAFWLGYVRHSGARFLKGPWHQRVATSRSGRELLIEHLPDDDRFVVAVCKPALDLDAFEMFEPNAEMEAVCERRALTYQRVLHTGASVQDAVTEAIGAAARFR